MTITLKKEVEEILEIPVPSFFKSKSGNGFIGLLDEKTVVEIYGSEDHKSISNSDVRFCGHILKRVPTEYHSCTETEFLEKYSEVERSMSLHPILTV